MIKPSSISGIDESILLKNDLDILALLFHKIKGIISSWLEGNIQKKMALLYSILKSGWTIFYK